MTEDRRTFIKKASMAAGIIGLNGIYKNSEPAFPQANQTEKVRVSKLLKPVAIAMWDFSWILRHHRYGEFENWDNILEGLEERGYMLSG